MASKYATMVPMLDTLTLESFSGLAGQTFRLTPENGPAMDLVLKEARSLALKTAPPGPTREPFSLLFVGPKAPVLPQRIYALEHETLGRLEIFLVPTGAGADGVQYEAIFN